MPILFTQSGLAIVAFVAMYVIYGLPSFGVIAVVVTVIAAPFRPVGSRWSLALFFKTFLRLAMAGGLMTLAASIYAYFTIP